MNDNNKTNRNEKSKTNKCNNHRNNKRKRSNNKRNNSNGDCSSISLNTGKNDASKGGKVNIEGDYNAPKWYYVNEAERNTAFNISTINFVGNRLPVDNTGFTTPGICVIKYLPTFGRINDIYSPINQMMRSINQVQRAANSGSVNYMMADQFMCIMAVHSMYAVYSHVQRMLGLWKKYLSLNRYFPETIIRALGVDPAEFYQSGKLNSWWNDMCVIGNMINTFWIPSGFMVTERTLLLNGNIFAEDDVAKAAMYAFVPTGAYIIDDITSETGTQLVYRSFEDFTSVDQYIDLLFEMGTKLQMMETSGTIFGDILKAFGANKCTSITPMTPEYDITIVKSEEILWQIHNSIVAGKPAYNLDVTQDVNRNMIKYNPRFRGVPYKLAQAAFLDFDLDNPSCDHVAVYTRLVPSGPDNVNFDSNGLWLYGIKAMGTEVVTGYEVWTFQNTLSGGWEVSKHDLTTVYYSDETDKFIDAVYLFNMFNLHPQIEIISVPSTTTESDKLIKATPKARLYDVHNYTTVSPESLSRMHETALRGEFIMRDDTKGISNK